MRVFVSIVAAGLFALCGCRSTYYADGGSSTYRDVRLSVLKVYSAEDGEHHFVAYLVKWKGSEVIVSDPVRRSTYGVGDEIPVLVVKTSLVKKDGIKINGLSFILSR